jgi:RNA polymerase sigma-70 factor, ECF subfamily
MPNFRPDVGTSLSLLRRAQDNDDAAWGRLVQIYSPLVFYWARRASLYDADAADLVQEVWCSVSTALVRFDHNTSTGTFRGWLWTITRNKIHDHFRKHQAVPVAVGGSDARQLVENVPDEEPTDESGVQDYSLLHRALDLIRPEFEERTWHAFWSMAVDGRSAGEVGAQIGMAANAVHQAKFRVLRRLREEMAGLLTVKGVDETPSDLA